MKTKGERKKEGGGGEGKRRKHIFTTSQREHERAAVYLLFEPITIVDSHRGRSAGVFPVVKIKIAGPWNISKV